MGLGLGLVVWVLGFVSLKSKRETAEAKSSRQEDCVCRPGKRPCGTARSASKIVPDDFVEPSGGSHPPVSTIADLFD